jgi:hypothetical protein
MHQAYDYMSVIDSAQFGIYQEQGLLDDQWVDVIIMEKLLK